MKASIKIEDIIFATRAEAEDALFKLQRLAEDYGGARVSDLYELAGLDCSYPMDNYIWMPHSLNRINIVRVRNGYMIDLPLAVYNGHNNAKVTYRSYDAKKPTPKPEPLTITINTDDIDDFDGVLAETFKHVYTITDRPVYISII